VERAVPDRSGDLTQTGLTQVASRVGANA